MRSSLLCLFALGCATNPGTSARDAGPSGLTVNGRVVDAESCAMGCEGLAGMVVRHDTLRLESAPTGPDGAFSLAGLPAGTTFDLVVSGPGFAETLNPEIATTSSSDLFGVRVYALPRGPSSLLDALEAELPSGASAMHVGQVVRAEGLALVAVEGARVTPTPPTGQLRMVNVLPRLMTGESALLPSDVSVTGRFGMYVIAADPPGSLDVALQIEAAGATFDPAATTLTRARPAYVLHQAR